MLSVVTLSRDAPLIATLGDDWRVAAPLRHIEKPWYAQAPWAGSGGAGPRRFGEAPGVLPRFDLFLSCGPGPRPWRGGPAPWRGGEMALALARLLPGVGVASSPVWDAASGDVHLAMRR